MRKLTFINTYHREGKSPPTFSVSFLWFFFFFLPQILFTLTVVALSSSSRSLLAHSLTAQLCPPLGRSLDWSPPSSSVHGIFQARTLEWDAIFSSKGSSQSKDWIHVSYITGRFFICWATGKPGSLGESSIWR